MSDPSICAATEHDLDAVLSLWRAAGSLPTVSDNREGLLGLLAADSGALLIAAGDGAVLGTLIAAWDGWRGNLYRLAVHPRRRRQGLALALVREGERRLRSRGAVRLSAIVAEEDPVALAFWRAAGYDRQPDRVRFVRHL